METQPCKRVVPTTPSGEKETKHRSIHSNTLSVHSMLGNLPPYCRSKRIPRIESLPNRFIAVLSTIRLLLLWGQLGPFSLLDAVGPFVLDDLKGGGNGPYHSEREHGRPGAAVPFVSPSAAGQPTMGGRLPGTPGCHRPRPSWSTRLKISVSPAAMIRRTVNRVGDGPFGGRPCVQSDPGDVIWLPPSACETWSSSTRLTGTQR